MEEGVEKEEDGDSFEGVFCGVSGGTEERIGTSGDSLLGCF